jgi:hypothetical protein
MQLSDWILACIGRQDARNLEGNHWIEEINARHFSI